LDIAEPGAIVALYTHERGSLIRVFIALVLAGLLFAGALMLFVRGKTVSSFLQLFGARCLVVVVLTHIAEAAKVLRGMGWGLERSPGHYLDLWSAALGVTLFPVGYFLYALRGRRQRTRD
jgi:hypothetical protein